MGFDFYYIVAFFKEDFQDRYLVKILSHKKNFLDYESFGGLERSFSDRPISCSDSLKDQR